MSPDVLLDPVVRGVVCGMAREMAPRDVPMADLASAAFVRILEADAPAGGIGNPRAYFKVLCRWAMLDHLRREGRLAPRDTVSIDDLGENVATPARADYPEPSDGLCALMGCLTDLEAEVVTFACGLDGAPGRTYKAVAWMTGKQISNTRVRLKRGLAKLRAALESRAGGPLAIAE